MRTLRTIFILSVAVLCASAVQAQTEDFEGAVSYADGYQVSAGSGDWAVTTPDNGPSYPGTHSLLYQGLSAGGTPVGYIRTQVFPVSSGTDYSVSVDYKREPMYTVFYFCHNYSLNSTPLSVRGGN